MKKKFEVEQVDEAQKSEQQLQDENRKKRLEEFPEVSFFALFRYATVFDKILMFIGVLGAMLSASVTPLNMLVFGDLSGNMIDYATAQLNGDDMDAAGDTLESQVHDFSVHNTLLGCAMFLGSYVASVCFNYTGIDQAYKIRMLYLEKVFNQDISWYDLHQSGDFASRMGDDLTKVEDGIGEKVAMFLHSLFTFFASVLMALIKGWELALICLISLPVTAFAMGLIVFVTSKFAKSESDAYGAAGAIAEGTFSSIRTVLAFSGEEKENKAYTNELVFARDNNITRSMFGGIGFGILWFCIYASYSLAFWYGIKLVLRELTYEDKTYDSSNMVSVFFSVMSGSMNLGMSAPFIEVFGIAKGAASKIFGVIDHQPVINQARHNGKQPEKIKGDIEFRDIHFHYPSRPDVPILRGLSLKINSGETVALVGTSGCGKSTTIQLIQRFYDPEGGDVYLDGNNLKELDLVWLRNNIGVVGQEPVLFGTSIAENIRYGMRTATQEQIERAAKKANAHRFISTLPGGYNTIVGERGAQLSGGQKQRIAIARALVREPTILLLDEATSALDTSSEAKVQAALDNASKDCTTIIVAHRLSTIRGANRIVVINKGQVSEQGTHDELMKKKGEYYELVMTQVSMVDEEDLKDKRVSVNTDDDDIPTSNNKQVKELTYADDTDTSVSFLKVLTLNKPEIVEICIGVLGSLIMGAAMPVFSVIFGNILSILQFAESDEDYVHTETRKYCMYFLAMGIVIGLATFASMFAFGIAAEKMVMRVRSDMFGTMVKQEIGWFDRKENGVGALCSKLSSDAAQIQGATGQRIGTIFQSLSTMGFSVGLAMYYQWKLGFVALAFTPIILGAMFLQLRSMKGQNDEYRSALETSTKLAVEAVGNIRTVVSLVCEEYFQAFYAEQLTTYIKKAKFNSHFRSLILALARSVMYFAFATCMFYGGKLIVQEDTPFEDILKASQSLILGTVSIANALAFAPNFQRGIDAAGKVFHMFNRQPEIQDTPNAKETAWKGGHINYKNIEFAYPTRPDTLILQGLNLDIYSGKTVALVGQSGCGKSTIIQLIERYYDPKSGVVSVDGDNLRDIKLRSLRSNLGIVSQEPNLFDRTIAKNIAYGDNSREITMDEIISAAKKANIHQFISGLPLGYNTPLGDKGAQLSGGQKQRVAIARALVRNPKVLLLDEATSALDTESEKVVQAALDEAKLGRTCITIAHRLTTIQDADVICVISEGVVTEMGTHSELIALKGIYYKLYSLQTGSSRK